MTFAILEVSVTELYIKTENVTVLFVILQVL
jgi:hypothetical protein